MKLITLSDGQQTKVSDEDFIWASGFNWFPSGSGCTVVWMNNKRAYLHKLIAERAGLDCQNQIDHIDRDKLNNQRQNLRAATNSQNTIWRQYNKTKSGYRGVVKHGYGWRARITINQQTISLGTFNTPEEAYDAYCSAAEYYFGEFANV